MSLDMSLTPAEPPPAPACPTAFRYWEGRNTRAAKRFERLVTALAGSGPFPIDAQASALCADLFTGDPVAERF
ncbi:hypothetical protein ACFXO7_17045, partial [Nocardia tengchongensis]